LYKGNVFTSGVSTAGGVADSRNNVEAVYFPAAAVSGAFTITVRATNLAGDGAPGLGDTTDQNFALVVFNGTECVSPQPPTVSAVTNGNNRIDVSWAAMPGATSYRVLRSTVSSGAFVEVGTPTSSPFIDTNVGAYITYYYVVRAVGPTCESGNSNEASATATGVPEPPGNLNATIAGATSVSLTWNASVGAVTYRVYRAIAINSFSLIATVSTTALIDNTVSANTSYLYKVTAVDGSLNQSADSNKALATTVVFTDPQLGVGTTVVKAVHFSELRTTVNLVRTLAGLSAATFTDPTLSSSLPVKRVHLVELRDALDQARSTLGLPVGGYLDPTVTQFSTTIKEMHVSNLRGQSGAYMPPTVSQLLLNPGFESGTANWSATPAVIDNTFFYQPRSGAWKAWLNGYGETHVDQLEQEITIPSNAISATLSFWVLIDTAEDPGPPIYDTLQVQIMNSAGTLLQTLATYSNVDATGAYVQKTFNVLAYKGQTIRVHFHGSEDEFYGTSFVIDDTALDIAQ